MLWHAESIGYVTPMTTVFSFLVAITVKTLAAAGAGQAVIGFAVDLVGMLLPPNGPALVTAERPGSAFAVLCKRLAAIPAALFLLAFTAAN